jgi:glycosyltransferase involved in cell wall biosynthesis
MHILIFTQFFPPEIGAAPRRIIENAKYWLSKGNKVTVVTSVPNSPFGEFFEGYHNSFLQKEQIEGIEIIRGFTVPAGKRSRKFRRLLSFVIYALSASIHGLLIKSPDIIVASAPYFSGIPGVLCGFLRKIPWIYDLRDPWIQSMESAGIIQKESIVFRILKSTERLIARKASRVVVIGQLMAKLIQYEFGLNKLPAVMPNGVVIDLLEQQSAIKIPEAFNRKFILGCLGNFNNPYDYEILFELAPKLSEHFIICLIGEGSQKTKVKKAIIERGIPKIKVLDFVRPSEVGSWVRLFDLSIVPLKANSLYDVFIPVRCLESMAVGTPVLFGGNGEIASILSLAKAGAAFPAGDVDAMWEKIIERFEDKKIIKEESENGKIYVRQNFSRKIIAGHYLNLLLKIAHKENDAQTHADEKDLRDISSFSVSSDST